ncbi:rna helicase [Holotrichia oblita]|uniref:Rna helicase n=1 Tax=Holotrichia oblita TaxID=644536 RepID=A0ACB9SQM4_HOLOL|nr:rna helicase [Holotrichia oblita]
MITKPTFTFSWDNNKQKPTQSTAFKKRNKTKSLQIDELNETRSNAANKLQKTSDIVPENTAELSSNKHVKRKKRKDKLLAKQLLKEGVNVDVSKLNNDNQTKNYALFTESSKRLHINVSSGKSVSEDVFATSDRQFNNLDIHRHLVSNLEKIDFKTLTNVQEKAIPIVMSGKNCLIRSQTGSGKTLAYAVPILDALQSISPRIKRTDGVQALIVLPTRELALQTHELFNKINTFQWIVTGHLCGGENRKSEKDRLRKGINILIGTPGRLLDHALHTSCFNLSKIRCLVLDEADRLLDMGFRKDVISLVEQIDKAKSNSEYDPMAMIKNQTKSNNTESSGDDEESLPILKDVNSKDRQTILLSATLNKDVSELANFAMKNHVYIDALVDQGNSTFSSGEIQDFIIPNTVKQEFMITFVKHRLFTLSALIVAKSKQNSKLFVFMASSHMVEFHYDLFTKYLRNMPKDRSVVKRSDYKGDKVIEFEDDVLEDDEEKTKSLSIRSSLNCTVLWIKRLGSKSLLRLGRLRKVSSFVRHIRFPNTDVAARGLDVPEADCIIQYTPPQSDKDYLHRVGRTGRAGKHGSAIIFLTHEEQEYVSHLREYKVFLSNRDPNEYLKHLCELMDQPNLEEAATALQRYFESKIANDKELRKSACFGNVCFGCISHVKIDYPFSAYSTWSRFYNSYPTKLRRIFNFKNVNLGHYVTSFALTITPTEVAQIVRGQVANVEKPRLNKKLALHE